MSRSGLENGLSLQEAECYLAKIGLRVEQPSLAYLNEISRRTLAVIPFQNLTMLTRTRVVPAWDQSVEDMLTGVGGLCNTINPFLCALLHRLGFRTILMPSAMQGEKGMHIAVGAYVNSRLYWLDCGNGFPYLQVLDTATPESCEFAGFIYSGRRNGQELEIIQSVLGTQRTHCNQKVTLQAVHISFFDVMLSRQYSEPDFGPFLTGIRLNRWQTKVGFVLRNNLFANYPLSFRKGNTLEIKSWIDKQFENEQLVKLYAEALESLEDDKKG